MSGSEWRETTLGKLLSLQRGHDLPANQRTPGDVPVVGSSGINGWHSEAKCKGPGVTIGRAANLGAPQIIETDFWPLNTTLYIKDFHGNDVRFIYNLFRTINLTGFDSGSVQPMLNRNYIQDFPVRVPPLAEQISISSVLGALDEKIAANDRAVETSRELMESLFLDATKEKREVHRLGSIAGFHNRKRVPLSAQHRKTIQGTYPYYGAAGAIDHIDDYLFSGPHLLVGEDGTVTEDGTRPMTQYVWGDFWVSNHAHVLTGTEISTELLAVAVRTGDVSPLVTGAVQPKLSMRNLSNLEVALPPADSRATVADACNALWAVVRSRTAESRTLAELRDTLLPQLMSAKLRVKDAEHAVENTV